MVEELNQEQITNTFKFVDASQSEPVKSSIFARLGRECFHARGVDKWLAQYGGNVQAFLDMVNVQHASTYWEKLEFTEDQTTLVLTGKIVQRCACALSECPEPPLSLCHYCCKAFQEEFFSTLLGRKVEVRITEAFLLGGERCSTTIHLVNE